MERTEAKYYTLHPSFREEVVPNSSFEVLVGKCLAPFERSTNGRRIRVSDGLLEPYSPFAQRQESKVFKDEAREVVFHYTKDLSQADRTWQNLTELSPKIVGILVGQDYHVDAVQRSHALNILAASLQMVRDRETKLVSKVGIGGSNAPFTSERLLAYGIPALEATEALTRFYEERRRRVLINGAINKNAQTPQDRALVGRNIRSLIEIRGIDSLVEDRWIDSREVEEILEEYAILKISPSLQFIFTSEAAIAINFGDDAENVRKRTQENIRALEEFNGRYYPDLDGQVRYLVDIPWVSLPAQTHSLLDYLSHLLENSPDPAVQKTVASLYSAGSKHGGKDQALRYAAMHRLAFSDPGNLPIDNYLIDYHSGLSFAEDAQIIVTYGCRREDLFNRARRFWETAEGAEDSKRSRMAISLTTYLARTSAPYYPHLEDWDYLDTSLSLENHIRDLEGKFKGITGAEAASLKGVIYDLKALLTAKERIGLSTLVPGG